MIAYMYQTNQETRLSFPSEKRVKAALFMKLSEISPLFLKHVLFKCEDL